ncbi:PREDICTED: kinesin-like protein KIF6 [Habropoda laboriosa]|uniref:kinesin-like protein KIF6 n=1 Tax=Habropoda laboriosa TaxID=597456 RepID=UPI00083E1A9C|nr:PREDICTED: kinesin-like protein KIF6 [Habropoda laboriosa]
MVKNAIKVYARLKPEKNRKNSLSYQVFHRPKENLEEDFLFLVSPIQRTKDYPDNRAESWNFSFFRILEESASQSDVFENVARPVVESALDGYNGTIFAYGQTASGKTYSITGSRGEEYQGIVPRSLRYLFQTVQKRPENVYSVEVAYLEIYNETGYDLLDRPQRQREFAITRLEDLPRISIQEDENGNLHLKNLTFHCVGSVEEAFKLLLLGDSNRITVETPMNTQSSRSHCIFTIVVSTKQFGAEQYKRAKVHLVDLAGSERVYKCSITGTILTEAKHINLSLHYLEQVIVCLGQESAGHIPYRNSVLTSILRDSLGGNCMTTMLATISVVPFNLEETLSTCRFAQRVALIRNDVKLNLETNVQSENALLKAENERLRRQIEALTGQTSEELTAEDKRNLDSQLRNFLEINEEICWDNNPTKVQYCFRSLKKVFQLSKDPKSCLKKMEYYKELVVQRDKEISLLLEMMKKEKNQRLTGTIENVSTVSNIQNDKQNSVINNNCSKKQKRRPKSSKSLVQNCANDDNSVKMSSNEKICDNVEANDVARSANLSACNIVNLTLNHLSEEKSKICDEVVSSKVEVNRESSRKSDRKQRNTVTKVTKQEDDKTKDGPLSNTRSRIKDTRSSSVETDYSIPVYQKSLNFNSTKRQLPEKPFAVKEDERTETRSFDRRFNSEEEDKFENSLPLTGDPEIDEEIIAFYKAKRSGEVY